MSNWVKFCIKYKMKFIPMTLCILLFWIYIIPYIKDAFEDFKRDFLLIRNAKVSDA